MAVIHNGLTVIDIQQRIEQSNYHQLFRPEVLAVNNDDLELVLRC